jgi:multimeric flavodoxin WrbA
VKVRVLGIIGSPRKGGHTEYMVREALESACQWEWVETDQIHVAEKEIQPCRACRDKSGRTTCFQNPRCVIDDDMTREIYDQLLEADGIIIGAATYFMSVPAQLKALIDRCIWLKMRKYWLKDKVGGALAVAAHPYGGQAAVIEDIQRFFLVNDMIVVNDGAPIEAEIEEYRDVLVPRTNVSVVWSKAHYPSGSAGSAYGSIEEDKIALVCSRGLGRRVAEVSRWVKTGKPKTERRVYSR